MRRILAPLLAALSAALLLVLAAPGAHADDPVPTPPPTPPTTTTPAPVEPYARYEPQTTCSPTAKPGAVAAQRWAVATYGGRAGGISRACGGSLSEHKEGRAFDWTLDARKVADRARAQRYLTALFATGPTGERAELARRMGVMYVIWNDRMYAAYRQFAPTAYVSSSCRGKPLTRCSATLRHRDHVHVSLSKAGGAGRTSWYVGRVARAR
ncbi:hypothetical protein [Marmoricola sp. Leaf446]|uniref:hypothetical protein n=1 Tax=Marmoricola sp. Leaf446 TaxID=1736379 RepID=UPI000B2EECC3|nr:hypothetical protein [Marmoricola sp. Leaf446]